MDRHTYTCVWIKEQVKKGWDAVTYSTYVKNDLAEDLRKKYQIWMVGV